MEFLKHLLSEKTYADLVAKLGDDLVKQIGEKVKDFKIDVAEEKLIPKSKFDEVNNQVKEYKEQITQRDTQLAELQKSAKGNEELTKQIETLTAANKQAVADYEAKILAREKEFATETLIASSGAKNVKAVRALLDDSKDAKEQIEALKKSDAYLFNIDTSKDGAGKGIKGKGKDGTTSDKERFAQFRNIN